MPLVKGCFMNGTKKLSILLLLASASAVYATTEAPKNEATPSAAKGPHIHFYEGGKECGSLLIKALKENDQAGQMAYAQKAQSYVMPAMRVLMKGDASSADAKAAWKNFQDFHRGVKEVFDKDTPKASSSLSDLEKQAFTLEVEFTNFTLDKVATSANFAEYSKIMQEKAQDFVAKKIKLAEEFQQKKEQPAKADTPKA